MVTPVKRIAHLLDDILHDQLEIATGEVHAIGHSLFCIIRTSGHAYFQNHGAAGQGGKVAGGGLGDGDSISDIGGGIGDTFDGGVGDGEGDLASAIGRPHWRH